MKSKLYTHMAVFRASTGELHHTSARLLRSCRARRPLRLSHVSSHHVHASRALSSVCLACFLPSTRAIVTCVAPAVMLGEIISAGFLVSASPASTKPQLATGPQKCVVLGPVSDAKNARARAPRPRVAALLAIVACTCVSHPRNGSCTPFSAVRGRTEAKRRFKETQPDPRFPFVQSRPPMKGPFSRWEDVRCRPDEGDPGVVKVVVKYDRGARRTVTWGMATV